MKKIRFESENGYKIEFSEKKPYILEKFDGNGLVGESAAVKIPGRDGKKTYGVTRGSRNITIECAVVSTGNKNKWTKQEMSENRDYVAKCFDPNYFGMLYYYSYRGDKGKQIRCKPTGLPAFDDDFNNLFKFRLGFESDGSVWEKVEKLYASLGMTVNKLRFPRFSGKPSAFALIYPKAVINNTTLYDIYPVVTVYDSLLPVHVLNKTTGSFLKFKIPTGIDRRIVIDIYNASAILEEKINGEWEYRENVIHYLTLDSRLTDFVIVPGENEFDVMTAEGEKPILTISAHEIVMGV